MFATMRPNQRQPTLTTGGAVCLGSAADTSFHDFVPPPPPMFENGGGTQCQGNNHVVPAIPHKNEEDDRNIQFLSMIEENGYEIEKIADGMADKIQLEKGGKIMSEEDEAFFWDWIISD